MPFIRSKSKYLSANSYWYRKKKQKPEKTRIAKREPSKRKLSPRKLAKGLTKSAYVVNSI